MMENYRCNLCGGELALSADKNLGICKNCGSVVQMPKALDPQPAAAKDAAIPAMLKRGQLALEDGEWFKADSFFEEVLNHDPENAEAYLGKLLAGSRAQNLEQLFAAYEADFASPAYEPRFACEEAATHAATVAAGAEVPGYLYAADIIRLYDFDRSYPSAVTSRKLQREHQRAQLAAIRPLSRAMQFASGELKTTLEAKIKALYDVQDKRVAQAEADEASNIASVRQAYADHIAKVDQIVQSQQRDAMQRRDEYYQYCVDKMKQASSARDYDEAFRLFESLGAYQDSLRYRAECQAKATAIRAEQARIRKDVATRKAKKTLRWIVGITSAIVLCLVGIILYKHVYVPYRSYKAAEELLKNGKPVEAALAFKELGDYRDSAERCFEAWGQATVRETVSAGAHHTVAVKSDGTVVAVGDNYNHKCDVSDWTDIVAVSAGTAHTVGLKKDGTVVSCGGNYYGECNVGNWDHIVAISAGEYFTVGLRDDCTVVATGANDAGQCTVDSWEDIVAVCAGSDHALGLKKDGTVVISGSQNLYALDDVLEWKGIVAVSAGVANIIGLKKDGTVVACGSNYHHPCDVEGWTDIVAVSAGSLHTVGLKADGTVVAVGANGNGQCNVEDWTDIVAVSGGDNFTIGLKKNGTVIAIGDNFDSQCNVSEWKNIKLPN